MTFLLALLSIANLALGCTFYDSPQGAVSFFIADGSQLLLPDVV